MHTRHKIQKSGGRGEAAGAEGTALAFSRGPAMGVVSPVCRSASITTVGIGCGIARTGAAEAARSISRSIPECEKLCERDEKHKRLARMARSACGSHWQVARRA